MSYKKHQHEVMLSRLYSNQLKFIKLEAIILRNHPDKYEWLLRAKKQKTIGKFIRKVLNDAFEISYQIKTTEQ